MFTNTNRILYLRTFRKTKPDHQLVAALAEAVFRLGKLVIVGPAEDGASLRRYWSSRYGNNARLGDHVEYIVAEDDQWRQTIHAQMHAASCIFLYLAPKGDAFPQIRRPDVMKRGIEEFYSAPLHDGSSGRGLLHEIVYLRRLEKLKRTIVLCGSKDMKYIDRLFKRAPLMGGVDSDMAPSLSGYFFNSTPKGLRAIVPRFSAFDKQLLSLQYARAIVSFTTNQVKNPSGSGFSSELGSLAQRIVREEKRARKIWRWHRLQPETLLGKSRRPRRLPPDNSRKIIQFTNVEDLLYIPRWEIIEVSLTEILDLLGEEAIKAGCPGCGAPLSRIFFFVRNLHRVDSDSLRGRCQQCFEPMVLEDRELIWY